MQQYVVRNYLIACIPFYVPEFHCKELTCYQVDTGSGIPFKENSCNDDNEGAHC